MDDLHGRRYDRPAEPTFDVLDENARLRNFVSGVQQILGQSGLSDSGKLSEIQAALRVYRVRPCDLQR